MLDKIENAIALFTGGDFLTGVLIGSTALAVGYLIVAASRWRPLPIAGPLLVVGALTALGVRASAPRSLWLGCVLLAIPGLVASPARLRWLALPLAVPGAWVVAFETGLRTPEWVGWLLVVTIVGGGFLALSFERRHRALGPLLIAATAFGVLVAVPDTEAPVALFGVAAPLALMAWPKPIGQLGAIGVVPVTALVLWVAAVGGVGRPASVIGAAACLGLFLAEPVARRLGRGVSALTVRRRHPLLVVSLHGGVVLVASRVAGLRDDPLVAGAIAAITLFVAVVVSSGRRAGR